MDLQQITNALLSAPIIAATDHRGWETALPTKAAVLFHLNASILTVESNLKKAKAAGKAALVHIDLADGIGKDKTGICWLANLGVDGIITTRSQLVRCAKECGLIAVQRFFVLDSKGMHAIFESLENTRPDLIEIMPGVIPKALKLFSAQSIPVIAGGLVETKSEVTAALGNGALAISTGRQALWNME